MQVYSPRHDGVEEPVMFTFEAEPNLVEIRCVINTLFLAIFRLIVNC